LVTLFAVLEKILSCMVAAGLSLVAECWPGNRDWYRMKKYLTHVGYLYPCSTLVGLLDIGGHSGCRRDQGCQEMG
jgi:hypothetical protein